MGRARDCALLEAQKQGLNVDFKPSPIQRLRLLWTRCVQGTSSAEGDGSHFTGRRDLLGLDGCAITFAKKRHAMSLLSTSNRAHQSHNVCVAHMQAWAGVWPDSEAPGCYTFALEEILPACGAGRSLKAPRVPHRRAACHPDLTFAYFPES